MERRQNRLIVVDYRVDKAIASSLAEMGELVLFRHPLEEGALSGHPDTALFYDGTTLIVAPNTPRKIVAALRKHHVAYTVGKKPSTAGHPHLAAYNAAGTGALLIHHTPFSEETILQHYRNQEIINVTQGYTRCSTLLLDSTHLITSDEGIATRCRKAGKQVCTVSPQEIVLPGLPYGLFGGCCGLSGKTVLIAGSLKYLAEGEKIRHFIADAGFQIRELKEAVPQDLGGIFLWGSPL